MRIGDTVRSLGPSLGAGHGIRLDGGYLSPHFVTDGGREECVFENALVLVHERRITSLEDLLPILTQVVKLGRPLLVIVESLDGEALATLVVNKLRGRLMVAAVSAPERGEDRRALLQDVAAVTGGRVVSEDLGVRLRSMKVADLGQARRVTITRDATTIVGRAGGQRGVEGRSDGRRWAAARLPARFVRE
jgi:chaperonin GroEL